MQKKFLDEKLTRGSHVSRPSRFNFFNILELFFSENLIKKIKACQLNSYGIILLLKCLTTSSKSAIISFSNRRHSTPSLLDSSST